MQKSRTLTRRCAAMEATAVSLTAIATRSFIFGEIDGRIRCCIDYPIRPDFRERTRQRARIDNIEISVRSNRNLMLRRSRRRRPPLRSGRRRAPALSWKFLDLGETLAFDVLSPTGWAECRSE